MMEGILINAFPGSSITGVINCPLTTLVTTSSGVAFEAIEIAHEGLKMQG